MRCLRGPPRSPRPLCLDLNPVVTFEKVTVTFFVTFFSCVFPRENPEKPQMLLCYLFWKGIHGRCTPALNLIRPSLPSRPSVGLPSSRAYPRLTAPLLGKTRLIVPNRSKSLQQILGELPHFQPRLRKWIRNPPATTCKQSHQLAPSCATCINLRQKIFFHEGGYSIKYPASCYNAY